MTNEAKYQDEACTIISKVIHSTNEALNLFTKKLSKEERQKRTDKIYDEMVVFISSKIQDVIESERQGIIDEACDNCEERIPDEPLRNEGYD